MNFTSHNPSMVRWMGLCSHEHHSGSVFQKVWPHPSVRSPIAGHSSKPSPKYAQAREAEFPIAQQSRGRGMEHLSYSSCPYSFLYHLFNYQSPPHDPPMPRKSTKIGVIAFFRRRGEFQGKAFSNIDQWRIKQDPLGFWNVLAFLGIRF